MSWRETWRETVESFLREVRDPDAVPNAPRPDGLSGAIAAARAEVADLERDLEAVRARHAEEEQACAQCERRRSMADRIGDRETAALAARFGERHTARAAILARKADVLRDELDLACTTLNELLDLARPQPRAGG